MPLTPTRVRTRTQVALASVAPSPLSEVSRPQTVVTYVPISALKKVRKTLRRKHKTQIENNAACIDRHGYDVPVVALPSGEILVGEDLVASYELLGRDTVPVIYLSERKPEQISAFRLWHEQLGLQGEWDVEAVKAEFEQICGLDPEWLSFTGWEMADIDLALHAGGFGGADDFQVADKGTEPQALVTRPSDLLEWKGGHRLLCGNARHPDDVTLLMGGRLADLFATDPPYGVAVALISGHHKEFLEGSGMSPEEALAFHRDFLTAGLAATRDGALVYLFIDAKGLHPLLTAALEAKLSQKALITWDKTSPSQGGGLYRNQSEFIVVAKHGEAKHTNNVRSAKGRVRTTVWSVPGYAQFRPDRKEALKNHSCTKPQALLLDILLDASNVGDVCYDPFCGSGSMLLAGHRTKRVVYGMEIDPEYIDTAVRRMFELTGAYPTHVESGLPFDQLATQRGIAWPAEALTAEPKARGLR